jgi:hypothetical protein
MRASIIHFIEFTAIDVVAYPRSVDANAPAGHYVVTAGNGNGSGTVYDTKSKLTWQQTVSTATYTWNAATTYCSGAGASLGGTGWRLPTIKELQSVVDLSQAAYPFIDPSAFPSTPSATFWSATLIRGPVPSYAWVVSFDRGFTKLDSVSSTNNVRCVR